MSYYAHHNENARQKEADARSREMNPTNPVVRAVIKRLPPGTKPRIDFVDSMTRWKLESAQDHHNHIFPTLRRVQIGENCFTYQVDYGNS